MSKDQLRSFLQAVSTDAALQEKLKDAAGPEAVVSVAQSAGFESISAIQVAKFLEYVAAQDATEEEVEELSSVTGSGLSKVAIGAISAGAGALFVAGAGWFAYEANASGGFGLEPNSQYGYSSGKSTHVDYSKM